MRQDYVGALISHTKAHFPVIEKEYEASLQREDIDPVLRISVKNFMENLRSALDYLARDIYDMVIRPVTNAGRQLDISRVMFPYGKDRKSFSAMINSRLPDLNSVNPAVFSLVEHVQPHRYGSSWLYDLCHIVNENKHNQLTPQTRKEGIPSYEVGPPGQKPSIVADAGAIRAREVVIDGKNAAFDPFTGLPLPSPGLQVNITRWVSFAFANTNIAVLPLLQTATREIETLAKKVYAALEIECPIHESGIYRARSIIFCERVETIPDSGQYTIIKVFDRVLWKGPFPADRKMAVVGLHSIREPGTYEFNLKVQYPNGFILNHDVPQKVTVNDRLGYGWVYLSWEYITFPMPGDYIFILDCDGQEYGRRILPVESL